MCIFFTPLENVVGFYISPKTWLYFTPELSLLVQHFQQKRSSNLHLHFLSSYLFLHLYVTLNVAVVRDS